MGKLQGGRFSYFNKLIKFVCKGMYESSFLSRIKTNVNALRIYKMSENQEK